MAVIFNTCGLSCPQSGLMFGDIALEPFSLALTHSLSPLFLTSEKLKEASSLLAETGCKVLQTYRADYVLLL